MRINIKEVNESTTKLTYSNFNGESFRFKEFVMRKLRHLDGIKFDIKDTVRTIQIIYKNPEVNTNLRFNLLEKLDIYLNNLWVTEEKFIDFLQKEVQHKIDKKTLIRLGIINIDEMGKKEVFVKKGVKV